MAVTGPVQVRHDIDELFEVLHGQLLYFRRTEYRDADWQLIDGSLAKVRGHDYFVHRLCACARKWRENRDD